MAATILEYSSSNALASPSIDPFMSTDERKAAASLVGGGAVVTAVAAGVVALVPNHGFI